MPLNMSVTFDQVLELVFFYPELEEPSAPIPTRK